MSKHVKVYEIIIVVDGFVDRTFELAEKIAGKNIKIFGYKDNKGKGYAVKYGVSRAKGDVIGFIDAGMDINPNEILIAYNLLNKSGADVVVGSKLHPASRVDYPMARRFLSWGYRVVTKILFGFSIRDTQVGLKLFRKKVAKDVFKRLLVKRFAFDIEVLSVAYSLGYTKILESPVRLSFSKYSTISPINFWITIFHMLWDTAAVFYRLRIQGYYNKI